MTPSRMEPATFRFVAQHLNHCATAVRSVSYILLHIKPEDSFYKPKHVAINYLK